MNDLQKAIKNAPTDLLCRAARTLQEAHDFVEVNEFDIDHYGAERNAKSCCFIGSVHHVVGESHGEPTWTHNAAALIALTALDMAAMNAGATGKNMGNRQAGGIAETFGFQLQRELTAQEPFNWDGEEDYDAWIERNRAEQKEKAIPVYRAALRAMHEELATRDDVPVETLA